MADVDPNYHSLRAVWWRDDSARSEVKNSSVHVLVVCSVQVEECFVAGAGEVKDGFLAVDFHFSGVFESFIESAAEGYGGCCC